MGRIDAARVRRKPHRIKAKGPLGKESRSFATLRMTIKNSHRPFSHHPFYKSEVPGTANSRLLMYTLRFHLCFIGVRVTRRIVVVACCLSSFLCLASAQTVTSSGAPQAQPSELTIEAIYADGGLLGRAPESIKWAPDGSRVAFVQRDDSGEKGALYYVDANHPQPAVLVAREKLASLAPPISNIKDERQKEAVQRYSVAAYHWSPDSKKLLFDSMGQLWLYNLDNGTAVQVTSSNDASVDPKFSPDGSRIAYVRKHNLYARDVSGGREDALTRDDDPNLLNGEVDWVYEEELYTRSNYFWSPDGKQIAFLQMNEKPVPDYPITDWIPTHSTVDEQKYPQPGDANPVVRLGVVASKRRQGEVALRGRR